MSGDDSLPPPPQQSAELRAPLLGGVGGSDESFHPQRGCCISIDCEDVAEDDDAAVEAATGSTPHAKPTSPALHRRLLRTASSVLLEPFADSRGSPRSILTGMATIVSVGMILGLSMPTNPHLPTPAYRLLSSIIGYTYFTCWTVGWYPQVVLNHRLRSASGVSIDSCTLDVLGFACYGAYTAALYWSPVVRDEYRRKYGRHETITVQSNDVAFALHSLALALVWWGQVVYYDRWRAQRPSAFTTGSVALIVVACAIGAVVMGAGWAPEALTWLEYLYALSFLKTCITVVVCMPQVLHNYRRQSTAGFTIWNVLLDISGGVLSIVQLVGDAIDLGDWDGITGNLAKLGIGLVSIGFDIVFLFQHYVLYHNMEGKEEGITFSSSSSSSSSSLPHDHDYGVLL